MILDSFANADRYAPLNPRLPAAFDFIRAFEEKPLPDGAYPICDGVVANVKRHTSMAPSTLRYETHNASIDLQYIAQGTEVMGWRSVPITTDNYIADRDVTFYDDLTGRPIAVEQGHMILFFPGDTLRRRRHTRARNKDVHQNSVIGRCKLLSNAFVQYLQCNDCWTGSISNRAVHNDHPGLRAVDCLCYAISYNGLRRCCAWMLQGKAVGIPCASTARCILVLSPPLCVPYPDCRRLLRLHRDES